MVLEGNVVRRCRVWRGGAVQRDFPTAAFAVLRFRFDSGSCFRPWPRAGRGGAVPRGRPDGPWIAAAHSCWLISRKRDSMPFGALLPFAVAVVESRAGQNFGLRRRHT